MRSFVSSISKPLYVRSFHAPAACPAGRRRIAGHFGSTPVRTVRASALRCARCPRRTASVSRALGSDRLRRTPRSSVRRLCPRSSTGCGPAPSGFRFRRRVHPADGRSGDDAQALRAPSIRLRMRRPPRARLHRPPHIAGAPRRLILARAVIREAPAGPCRRPIFPLPPGQPIVGRSSPPRVPLFQPPISAAGSPARAAVEQPEGLLAGRLLAGIGPDQPDDERAEEHSRPRRSPHPRSRSVSRRRRRPGSRR